MDKAVYLWGGWGWIKQFTCGVDGAVLLTRMVIRVSVATVPAPFISIT